MVAKAHRGTAAATAVGDARQTHGADGFGCDRDPDLTDQVPAAKTPAKDADTPPGDAGEGPAEKRGLFGWALRR
ncbi:MAG: hypothetical protein KDE27_15660, partial [Planctomycetes bacterium]|nr:hypothetical protein [Planctomycetota bacterium]